MLERGENENKAYDGVGFVMVWIEGLGRQSWVWVEKKLLVSRGRLVVLGCGACGGWVGSCLTSGWSFRWPWGAKAVGLGWYEMRVEWRQ